MVIPNICKQLGSVPITIGIIPTLICLIPIKNGYNLIIISLNPSSKREVGFSPRGESKRGENLLLQHNLLNINRIALWVNNSHKIQSVTSPSCDVNIELLLIHRILEHLLTLCIFDFDAITVHSC